jgi:uncharacterized membrane protein YoaK (UPF0700 family)
MKPSASTNPASAVSTTPKPICQGRVTGSARSLRHTTQLAVALGHGEPLGAVLPALLIGAFLVGAVSGGAIAALCPPRWVTPAVLGLEAVALTAAVALAAEHAHVGVASLFLALAMGGQNAVLAHVQGFRAGTTFVTGALFAFGQKAALALAGRGPRLGARAAIPRCA